MPTYFDRYINLVADVELQRAFADSVQQINDLDESLLTKLNGKRYAPDKWTVKEIFQHIIDWERILSYRALLFAREKDAVSPNVDGDLFAANMKAERRSSEELIDELKIVRASTVKMFESFDDRMLLNTGVNWKYETSVLATGFCLVGHQIHHLKIIEDKYFPLLAAD